VLVEWLLLFDPTGQPVRARARRAKPSMACRSVMRGSTSARSGDREPVLFGITRASVLLKSTSTRCANSASAADAPAQGESHGVRRYRPDGDGYCG
jgi:hypothetical protein